MPTGTYSIIAMDAVAKQVGGAMQTHNFAACNGVIWAQPGVGVVASQAASDPTYAFLGFEMMRLGKTASQVLEAVRQTDTKSDFNQVAVVDIHGNVAVHTGSKCLAEAGHLVGNDFSCQANIMRNGTVWHRMAEAFQQSKGDLGLRLIEALEAGEDAGGDFRGAQSAAIKIVTTERPSLPWDGFLVDYRVYDSLQPLAELRRLVTLDKAYKLLEQAHARLETEPLDQVVFQHAMDVFDQAIAAIPNLDSRLQQKFEFGLALYNKGKTPEALDLLGGVFETKPEWREIASRIARAYPNAAWALRLDEILAA